MEFCDIKRFLEWWIGDPLFRKGLAKNPWGTVNEYKVEVNPLAASILYEGSLQDYSSLPSNTHPAVKAFCRKMDKLRENSTELRNLANTNNRIFSVWRSRQIARLAGQDHSKDSDKNPHMLFAIELNKGCLIQCDYCGVAAGPLRAVARFDRENETLFRDILHSFLSFFGNGAHIGLLYWATEPLDNPDYEKYLTAFYEEFGRIPETTTAAWDRDVNRTRKLLRQNKKQKSLGQRFSINSISQLNFCMETFSAKELEKVELIINHPGALTNISRTGRARQIPRSIDGTSACVTGFLINLPEQTVKLISPCIEPKRWPLGYRIFRKARFKDGKNLLQFMRECESEIMDFTLQDNQKPRLRDDLRITENKNGKIILTSKYRKFTVPEGLASELVRAFDGKLRLEQIVNKLSKNYSEDDIQYAIEIWWEQGFIEDIE
ncbi:MAG: radical SAM family RiPP maturation amino acid epimerase [Candidatus Aminicenantes bacterium]